MAFRKKKQKSAEGASLQEPMTLMQHVDELKNRLFWVAVVFVVASACVYPFFNQIIAVLTDPVGEKDLYYFSVTGGLSFIIKICMYVGIIAAIPALIYHMYKFIAPVMNRRHARNVAIYTLSSAALALVGIVFSYYIILPAALKFLTEFSFGQINSMLSIDSYVSFVIAYLVAGALLFQLPVILLAINTVHRLKPRKLLSYERYVIIGAFIFAAILSPTPDAMNQALMAAPIIIMYQVGIALVWWAHRREAKKLIKAAKKRNKQKAKAVKQVHTAHQQPAGTVFAGQTAAAQRQVSALSSMDVAFDAGRAPLGTKRQTQAPRLQVAKPSLPQSTASTLLKSAANVPKQPYVSKQATLAVKQQTAKKFAPRAQTLHLPAPPDRPLSPRPIVSQLQTTPLPSTARPRMPLQRRTAVRSTFAVASQPTPSRPAAARPGGVRTQQARRGLDGFGVYASA